VRRGEGMEVKLHVFIFALNGGERLASCCDLHLPRVRRIPD